MKVKAMAKSVLVPVIIGTLVSAQQVSAESVFTPKGFDSIHASAAGPLVPTSAPGFRALAEDTVETFDVEIEEEKGPGIGKQLAVFAIITAIVAYAVIELMKSDDEPTEPAKPPGREIPTSSAVSASAALTR